MMVCLGFVEIEPNCSFVSKREVILLLFEIVKWIENSGFGVKLRNICLSVLNDVAELGFDEEVSYECQLLIIRMRDVVVALGDCLMCRNFRSPSVNACIIARIFGSLGRVI
jgi:hypothetical protein